MNPHARSFHPLPSRPAPTFGNAVINTIADGQIVNSSPVYSTLRDQQAQHQLYPSDTYPFFHHTNAPSQITVSASYSSHAHDGPHSSNANTSSHASFAKQQAHSLTTRDSSLDTGLNLADQRIFPFDDRSNRPLNRRPLEDYEVDFLVRAIRLARRLVFSARSLNIFQRFIWKTSDWGQQHGSEQTRAALEALAENDGMSVFLDGGTQAGHVSALNPRRLGLSATLLRQATATIARPDKSCIRRHLFYITYVLAHLICGSIRHVIAKLPIKGWGWENAFFGGTIERVMAPESRATFKGEIEQIVISIRKSGWVFVSEQVLLALTDEGPGWEGYLPLRPHPTSTVSEPHPRRRLFHEVSMEEGQLSR